MISLEMLLAERQVTILSGQNGGALVRTGHFPVSGTVILLGALLGQSNLYPPPQTAVVIEERNEITVGELTNFASVLKFRNKKNKLS